MSGQKHIILSLTDGVHAIKKWKWLILYSALFFSALTFCYFAFKPIHFTSCGIFKSHVSQPSTPLIKALEFLGREESVFSCTDHLFLLQSYPVLEGVARALNLQATITEKTSRGRLTELYYTLKTAKAYKKLKKHKIPSSILSLESLTPTELIVPDQQSSLRCIQVEFTSETALSLRLVFLDDKTFRVFNGKKDLGLGTLETPFSWQGNSFTLSGKGKKGKKIGVHLISLNSAIESLKKTLKVAKNKENNSFIDISYTHRNRHLAAQIVNETMQQFQYYLRQDGQKKINKQLLYLKQRQEETLEELDSALQKQTDCFMSNLKSGVIITLEKELEFMAEEQAEKKQQLIQINAEIHTLVEGLQKPFSTQDSLFAYLKETKTQNLSYTLTIEAARSLIAQYEQQLDRIFLDNERYAHCLQKLSETDFDSISLLKTLNDESLRPQFEKINSLHHHLVDEKNWTQKERDGLKEELATEKRSMIQQIRHLKEGSLLNEKILKEKTAALQENLLYLLFDKYEQITKFLGDLNDQASYFPQKWLNEQKIELHTKLYADMMESITKMIEAKNIGYNIDYLMSNALQPATAAVIPDHPHLIRKALLAGFLAALCVVLAICFYQAWQGPSACYENLLARGLRVMPKALNLSSLAYAIVEGKKVVLITSKQKVNLGLPIKEWLEQRGEKVFVMDLTISSAPGFIEGKNREAFMASEGFKKQLDAIQEHYDRLLIISQNLPKSLETQILISYSDTILYGVSHETLVDVKNLPKKTLFFILQKPKELFQLRELEPLLARAMKRFSFSSVTLALKQFLSKRP